MSGPEREQDRPLLTTAQLRRMVEESEDLGIRKAALDRRIDAAKLFVSPAHWEEIVNPPPEPVEKLPSWTSVIMAGLKKAGRGLTYDELREVVNASPLAKKLKRSEKSFYGAVGKLETRGEVKRHNGRVYTTGALAEFRDKVAAGLVSEEAAKAPSKRSPMGDAVRAFVDKNPQGVTGGDIVSMLKATPAHAATVNRNASAAYNVIARLVRYELIRKDGRVYLPISGATKYPNGEQSLNGKGAPQGTPSAGGVHGSSLFSH